MNSGIYLIFNSVNSKRYIGSASNIKTRWYNHKYYLRHNKHINKHLQSAWNKYGESNFIFEIVCECDDSNRIEFENYYIKVWKTRDRKYGYNQCEASIGSKGYKHTKEAINKISQASIGNTNVLGKKIHTEERKRYLSDNMKDNKYRLGISHTKEVRENIGNKLRGIKKSKDIIAKMVKAQQDRRKKEKELKQLL